MSDLSFFAKNVTPLKPLIQQRRFQRKKLQTSKPYCNSAPRQLTHSLGILY